MSLIVDAVHEDRQEQAEIDVVGVEQWRPGAHPQPHGGVESLAPRARVNLAVWLDPVDRFEAVGCRRKDVADVVVTHRDGGDRRELRGAAMVIHDPAYNGRDVPTGDSRTGTSWRWADLVCYLWS